MILPQTSSFVFALMVLSLLCLGAWVSTLKATGKWRFELYYFDFAFGLMLTALICSFTLGDLGFDGFNFLDDIQHAGKRQWMFAFMSGVVFNLGQMLLTGASSIAGTALAFPSAFGVALLVSTLLNGKAAGNTTMALLGCGLILASFVVNAVAYRILGVLRHEQLARAGVTKSTRRPNPVKGIILTAASGILMGSISGLMLRARDGDFGLGPYAAAALFTIGAFGSTFVFNIFLINLPIEGRPVDFAGYFKGGKKQHLLGLAGGALWYLGILAAQVAGTVPESLQPAPLMRFLLAQGAPVITALLGIVLWKEIKGGDMRVRILAFLMIVLFVCGLTMIGLGSLDQPRT